MEKVRERLKKELEASIQKHCESNSVDERRYLLGKQSGLCYALRVLEDVEYKELEDVFK